MANLGFHWVSFFGVITFFTMLGQAQDFDMYQDENGSIIQMIQDSPGENRLVIQLNEENNIEKIDIEDSETKQNEDQNEISFVVSQNCPGKAIAGEARSMRRQLIYDKIGQSIGESCKELSEFPKDKISDVVATMENPQHNEYFQECSISNVDTNEIEENIANQFFKIQIECRPGLNCRDKYCIDECKKLENSDTSNHLKFTFYPSCFARLRDDSKENYLKEFFVSLYRGEIPACLANGKILRNHEQLRADLLTDLRGPMKKNVASINADVKKINAQAGKPGGVSKFLQTTEGKTVYASLNNSVGQLRGRLGALNYLTPRGQSLSFQRASNGDFVSSISKKNLLTGATSRSLIAHNGAAIAGLRPATANTDLHSPNSPLEFLPTKPSIGAPDLTVADPALIPNAAAAIGTRPKSAVAAKRGELGRNGGSVSAAPGSTPGTRDGKPDKSQTREATQGLVNALNALRNKYPTLKAPANAQSAEVEFKAALAAILKNQRDLATRLNASQLQLVVGNSRVSVALLPAATVSNTAAPLIRLTPQGFSLISE